MSLWFPCPWGTGRTARWPSTAHPCGSASWTRTATAGLGSPLGCCCGCRHTTQTGTASRSGCWGSNWACLRSSCGAWGRSAGHHHLPTPRGAAGTSHPSSHLVSPAQFRKHLHSAQPSQLVPFFASGSCRLLLGRRCHRHDSLEAKMCSRPGRWNFDTWHKPGSHQVFSLQPRIRLVLYILETGWFPIHQHFPYHHNHLAASVYQKGQETSLDQKEKKPGDHTIDHVACWNIPTKDSQAHFQILHYIVLATVLCEEVSNVFLFQQYIPAKYEQLNTWVYIKKHFRYKIYYTQIMLHAYIYVYTYIFIQI